MFIYIAIFIFIALLALAEQIIGKKHLFEFRLLLAAMLIVFAAFRPEGGDRDYENYLFSFELFLEPSDYFTHYFEWAFFDPMYYLIPSFIKTFISQYSYAIITFIFFSLLAVSLKFSGINKLSRFFFLSVLVYFSNFYLLHEMTQIRAAVATGLFLTGLYYFEKKSYLTFFILILVAFLFHYSSLIYLFLFFINSTKINFKIYFGLMAATLLFAVINMGFIFSFFNLELLGPLTMRASSHVEMTEYGIADKINKLNVMFLASFAITAMLVFFSDAIYQQNKYAYLLLKIQVWGLFIFQFFSAVSAIAFRFSELFLCVQILTLPFIVYLFRNRWIGVAMVILISGGYFWINLFYEKLMKPYFG